MFPLDDNVRLLPELKKHGFRLYYLSNFPLDSFEEVKNDYFFFRYFDGGIISAEVKLSKPDIRIYRHILNKYGLKAEESVISMILKKILWRQKKLVCLGLLTNGSVKISTELGRVLILIFDLFKKQKPPLSLRDISPLGEKNSTALL